MALTYRTITETLDFGPHITKIILEAGRPLTGAKLDPAQARRGVHLAEIHGRAP